jgi:hypothetical protein
VPKSAGRKMRVRREFALEMRSEEEEDWHAEISWAEWLSEIADGCAERNWPPLHTSVPIDLDSLLMRTVLWLGHEAEDW